MGPESEVPDSFFVAPGEVETSPEPESTPETVDTAPTVSALSGLALIRIIL